VEGNGLTFNPKVDMMVEFEGYDGLERGRIVGLSSEEIQVFFKGPGGSVVRKFRRQVARLTKSLDQSTAGYDNATSRKAGAPRSPAKPKVKSAGFPMFSGFDGAVAVFKAKYVLGFEDAGYLKEERSVKLKAREAWEASFGHGQAKELVKAGNNQEIVKRVLGVLSLLNLQSPFDKIALKKALLKSHKVTEWLEAVLASASAKEGGDGFEALLEEFRALDPDAALKVATWPNVTLLPFLITDKGFPFIKPEVTKAVALGLGVEVSYESKLNAKTYSACCQLYADLFTQLAPLGARDWLDVQSFIWVVGSKA